MVGVVTVTGLLRMVEMADGLKVSSPTAKELKWLVVGFRGWKWPGNTAGGEGLRLWGLQSWGICNLNTLSPSGMSPSQPTMQWFQITFKCIAYKKVCWMCLQSFNSPLLVWSSFPCKNNQNEVWNVVWCLPEKQLNNCCFEGEHP